MSSDSNYFYVLNQVEIDLSIDHEDLLRASKENLGKLLDLYFARRSVITGTEREPSDKFKAGVYRVKEDVRELEQS